jgi:hypothetical protein
MVRLKETLEDRPAPPVHNKDKPLYAIWEPSAYFLDGWQQYNRERWGLEPCRRRYTLKGKELPALEVVLYLDRRGRVCQPPRNNYVTARFLPPEGSGGSPRHLMSQWLALSAELAKELRDRGVRGQLTLPPGFIDGREFRWHGFRVGISYTYIGRLPHDYANTDIRRRCKKARQSGYYVERTNNWEAVRRCLLDTGRAKGFTYWHELADIELCAKLLGREHFYAFGGFAPDGEMVCADLELHVKGGIALKWALGTCREHLSSGVTQLVHEFALDRVTEDGAVGLDWVSGGDDRSTAAYKGAWGLGLVPHFTISENNVTTLLKECVPFVRGWVGSIGCRSRS